MIIDSWSDFNLDNHPFISQVDWINEIIEPINKHFNLNSFNYHKTYFDNYQIRLTNKPEWYKYYLRNKLYLNSVFELEAHKYEFSYMIWSTINSHNIIVNEAANFGIYNGITFINKQDDGCEFFFLGTTSNDAKVLNNLILNVYQLIKFITCFNMNFKKLEIYLKSFKVKSYDIANYL